MSRRALTLLISFVSISAVVSVYLGFSGRESSNINIKTSASIGSVTLSSEEEWGAGVNINTLLNDPSGVIKINQKEPDSYNLSSATITADPDIDKGLAADGDCETFWWDQGTPDSSQYWQIDLGEVVHAIPSVTVHGGIVGDYPLVHTSLNGIDWTFLSEGSIGACGEPPSISAFDVRYLKVQGVIHPWEIWEVAFFQDATATHTSAATQLDAGVCDSSEWTTFVPDDTIPANTSINYRFRTSADAAT